MLIEIKNYTKIIKDQTVLNDINLHMEAGHIYGFVGRNGSGKTMLFKAICGFIKPTMGFVKVAGKQIGLDIDIPESTGIMIDSPGFINEYSAFKNLKILTEINNEFNRDKITNVLSQVGLDPKSNKKVRSFSLGMKQRLCFAQAIMDEPNILILDEPMNSLDKEGIIMMRKQIKQMKYKGCLVLLCSHIEDDINELCDYKYTLDCGKIVKCGE